jgi:hypothetical protein
LPPPPFPAAVGELLKPLESGQWLFLLGVALLTMVFGMVLEGLPAAVVLIPVVFPIATSIGSTRSTSTSSRLPLSASVSFCRQWGGGPVDDPALRRDSGRAARALLRALCPGLADRTFVDHLPA